MLITGFLGVPILVLSAAGVADHVCAWLWMTSGILIFALSIWKQGGPRRWLQGPLDGATIAAGPLVPLVGLIFAAAGMGIIIFGEPAKGPRAMSRGQIEFFGTVFVLLGVGLMLLSTARRRHR